MFAHNIDPIFAQLGGFYLWYYGATYSLGFIVLFLWFRLAMKRLKISINDVYGLTIYLCLGVLLGGRIIEVIFYEWGYYRENLMHIPFYWLGGMSTHGILLGVLLAMWLFCKLSKRDFLELMDELVIPGMLMMGLGRFGNFIDGQIKGAVTNVWWGVKFPEDPGSRHPVVLYDGIKNIMLAPFLLGLSRFKPPKGVVVANALFWYAFLRLFVDLFREYRTQTLHLGTGQVLNITMAAIGLLLMVWFFKTQDFKRASDLLKMPEKEQALLLWFQRGALIFLILFPLIIPSDWTQDVPARYGKRHPGIKHSNIYPRISGN